MISSTTLLRFQKMRRQHRRLLLNRKPPSELHLSAAEMEDHVEQIERLNSGEIEEDRPGADRADAGGGGMSEHTADKATGHAWVEGRCVTCGVEMPRPWAETCRCAPPGTAAALSLLLRQAAREHLGLAEGDYWPSDIAAAQASALLDSGWRVTPPGANARPRREDGSLTRGLAWGVALTAPLWALLVWVVAQIPPLTLGAVAACLVAAALAAVWLRVSDARWERERQP